MFFLFFNVVQGKVYGSGAEFRVQDLALRAQGRLHTKPENPKPWVLVMEFDLKCYNRDLQ